MRIKLTLEGIQKADLSQFTGNNLGEIDGCEVFVDSNRTEAEAWFIIENANPQDSVCTVPTEQIHFLSAETSYSQSHYLNPFLTSFLRQFSHIHSCHPVPLENVNFSAPFLPWMINANHGTVFSPHHRDLSFFENLQEISKSKKLSVFCSDQDYTPDHKLRLAFVRKLESHFGEDIDWFGNGIRSIPTKWDGLATYERTLVLENRSDRGIYSEKILDPYLSLTSPIYWGAPDIDSYLPIDRDRQIDIRDFSASIKTIEDIISSPLSNKERDQLIFGKQRVTGELHFLRRIVRAAKQGALSASTSKVIETTLRPREDFRPKKSVGVAKKSALDRAYLLARKVIKGR